MAIVPGGVNNSPATGSVAMYQRKEYLKSAGWTVPRSSDGTTYNAAGDQITSGASGANGMANANAWFILRDPNPSNQREELWQRGSTDLLWRCKYSSVAKFSGGSPSATQTPSATDEVFDLGGGTDAAPTFQTLFPANNTYRWHCIADNAAHGGVFGHWAFALTNATGVGRTSIICEPMDTNSYTAADSRTATTVGDADPCVREARFESTGTLGRLYAGDSATTGGWGIATPGTNGAARAFRRFGLSGAVYLQARPLLYVTSTNDASGAQSVLGHLASTGFGTDAETTNDEGFPIPWGRVNGDASPGFKGFGRYLRWKGVSSRGNTDTINLAGAAYIYVDQVLIPWPTGVAPAL